MFFPRLTLLLGIFLLLVPVLSLAQSDNKANPDESGRTSAAEKADPAANQPVEQKPDTTTVTPSEKIRADDAVSFPVDI